MKTLQLHEKARLSESIEAVQKGENIIISRYGKPVVKLSGLEITGKRELGFYPLKFETDFLEPSDNETLATFCE